LNWNLTDRKKENNKRK